MFVTVKYLVLHDSLDHDELGIAHAAEVTTRPERLGWWLSKLKRWNRIVVGMTYFDGAVRGQDLYLSGAYASKVRRLLGATKVQPSQAPVI